MFSILARLYRDESGFVGSTETVLMATVLVIGMIVGLVAVRDAVANELGDVATTIFDLNHTYSYSPVITDCGTAAGAVFIDESDFCTPGFNDDDPPGRAGPVYFNPPGGAQPE